MSTGMDCVDWLWGWFIRTHRTHQKCIYQPHMCSSWALSSGRCILGTSKSHASSEPRYHFLKVCKRILHHRSIHIALICFYSNKQYVCHVNTLTQARIRAIHRYVGSPPEVNPSYATHVRKHHLLGTSHKRTLNSINTTTVLLPTHCWV